MAAEEIPFNKASANIGGVAYDEETTTLTVQFKGKGATYEYSGVPAQVATGFTDAASAGQYFDQNIKGKYQFKKL